MEKYLFLCYAMQFAIRNFNCINVKLKAHKNEEHCEWLGLLGRIFNVWRGRLRLMNEYHGNLEHFLLAIFWADYVVYCCCCCYHLYCSDLLRNLFASRQLLDVEFTLWVWNQMQFWIISFDDSCWRNTGGGEKHTSHNPSYTYLLLSLDWL